MLQPCHKKVDRLVNDGHMASSYEMFEFGFLKTMNGYT
jgi:hypothetical protein